MPSSIFLSYRRSDSQHATLGIADRLRWSFGWDEVFLDRGSIESGAEWPQTIQKALASAKVVLVIIGPEWLQSWDVWGRRRLDDQADWVRREVCAALAARQKGRTQVIPVYLDDTRVPAREALDGPLQPLLDLQEHRLTSEDWEPKLKALLERIAKIGGLSLQDPDPKKRNSSGPAARPKPTQRNRRALSDEEVRSRLESLAGWQLQWSAHPWGAGGRAQEIAKTYEFSSFRRAVDFIHEVSLSVEGWDPPHHPRWENQWKAVTASFTTWDVDCRVTKLDIEAAEKLDSLYHDSGRRAPPRDRVPIRSTLDVSSSATGQRATRSISIASLKSRVDRPRAS